MTNTHLANQGRHLYLDLGYKRAIDHFFFFQSVVWTELKIAQICTTEVTHLPSCVDGMLYLPHIEYQITHSTSTCLAALYYFKGLFEGQVIPLRLRLELGLG